MTVTDLERGMIHHEAAFRHEARVAIDAVERALELARRGVGAADITTKGGRDLMTATDLAVEDAVRTILSDTVGSFVVGEERGGEAPADGSPYWLVDPICGTRNFASGMPLYCVNLALVEGDQITVAVVGDPSTDDTYGPLNWELPGGGAERGENIVDTAVREVLEETSLHVVAQHTTGIYYDVEADMLHFVFLCQPRDTTLAPRSDGEEISECGFWSPTALPRPLSDFTVRRIVDAISGTKQPLPAPVRSRRWLG